MKVDSLQQLGVAFAAWRQRKQFRYEKTPLELLIRARQAAKKHGLSAVVQATGIDRKLLGRATVDDAGEEETADEAVNPEPTSNGAPAFSRLSLSAPIAPQARPLVEVETASGVKLRVFEQTPEIMSLLSAACQLRGAR